jgi:hypothetical protein
LPATARAIDIAPNEGGYLGAWLVASPHQPVTTKPDARGPWRVATDPDGFSVEQGTQLRGGFAGLVGGTLVLAEPERLWIALSGGGKVDLYVDGRHVGGYAPVRGSGAAWWAEHSSVSAPPTITEKLV